MRVNIVHSIRGRVRLRLPDVGKSAELWQALGEWIGGQRHVLSHRVNEDCFSLIVCYDANASEAVVQIVARLEALSVAELRAVSPLPVPSSPGLVTRALSLLQRLVSFDEKKSFACCSVSIALTLTPIPVLAALAVP